jgi:hypothetical protein
VLLALSWTTLGCNSDNGAASLSGPQTGSAAKGGAGAADAGAV